MVVQYFGSIRDAARKPQEEIALAPGTTVYRLPQTLAGVYGDGFRGEILAVGGENIREDLSVAVNGSIVKHGDAGTSVLRPGDTVALFPLFPGGDKGDELNMLSPVGGASRASFSAPGWGGRLIAGLRPAYFYENIHDWQVRSVACVHGKILYVDLKTGRRKAAEFDEAFARCICSSTTARCRSRAPGTCGARPPGRPSG
ncbi:MAG: MoaD/ThiS family protein [Firmicutes bacterium]|nr:MoaD/ThiS family protein [Bacillota bacterium]